MNPIKRFIGRLLFPGRVRFVGNLSNALVRSVKGIDRFDADVKSLCTTWLAVCPYTYFSELFLEGEDWCRPFATALEKSGMINAQGCFNITQAYYLRHLKRIISEDSVYEKFSLDLIEANIQDKMEFGDAIIKAAAEFEESITDMSSPEDFSTGYIEKVMSIQYPDEAKRSSCLSALWIDSKAMFGLLTFTIESLKKAKLIDSQSGDT